MNNNVSFWAEKMYNAEDEAQYFYYRSKLEQAQKLEVEKSNREVREIFSKMYEKPFDYYLEW